MERSKRLEGAGTTCTTIPIRGDKKRQGLSWALWVRELADPRNNQFEGGLKHIKNSKARNAKEQRRKL